MKISELVPEPKEKTHFTLRYRKFVPRASGCYLLTTFESDILYVGITDNLHRRFGEHREVNEKREPTAFGFAFWFYYLSIQEKDIYRIERSWLNQHQTIEGKLPVLNKVASPVW
jgi:hypothetical protein